MKLFSCLMFIILSSLLSGCASTSQKGELYQAYITCMNENKVPKVDARGIVALDKKSNPIMTYKKGACTAENAAYNVAAQKRDRHLERMRSGPTCHGSQVLICNGRCNARDMERQRCSCKCVSSRQTEDMLRGFGRRY